MDRAGEVEILPTAPGGAVEGGLVSETQWGAVRALRERWVSVRRIARKLGLDR